MNKRFRHKYHMQHRTRLSVALFSAFVLCALGMQAAHADLRVQVEESVNGAKPASVTHWFGNDRSMRDDGNRYIITNLRTDQSIIVDREKKTYKINPLMLETNSALPQVVVTRTEDTRKIDQWMARRYHLSGPATRGLKIDIWVTHDLQIDITTFHQLMIKLGNRSGSAWLKAYKKIDGFPVLQQVKLTRPGITLKSESRVVSVTNIKQLPADIYQPPEGYARLP